MATPSIAYRIGFVLSGVLLLIGCNSSSPAPNSGFLDDAERMRKVERNPFQRSWFDRQIQPDNYTELLVRPVNMKYVMAENFWEQANLRSLDDLNKDFQQIADYTRQAFIKAAEKDPKKRFQVVDKPGPKTAILELAIVQLVPTKAALNALGIVAPMGSVMVAQVAGGTLANSEDMGKGVVAIEGRIRDGATGDVIFMFADRRNGKAAVVDLASYSWWGPARYTIDDWADELIRLASTPENQKVKAASSFELLVW